MKRNDSGLSDVRDMLGVDTDRKIRFTRHKSSISTTAQKASKVNSGAGGGVSDARAMLGVDLDMGVSSMASRRMIAPNGHIRLPTSHTSDPVTSNTSAQNTPVRIVPQTLQGVNNVTKRILPAPGNNTPAETGRTSGLLGRLGL